MSGYPNNKVYINPNFKRPVINTWPSIHINSKNLRFPHQMPSDTLSVEKKTNGKIYVNPNFKHTNQVFTPQIFDTDENIEAYPKLISKSKYSLVTNVNKCKVDDKSTNIEISPISMNVMSKINVLSNQNICTQKAKGVPIIKSRYAIVRTNSTLNCKEEIKQSNFKQVKAQQLNCTTNTNNSSVKILENTGSSNKPSQKIAKIKISKYKTVPITYLNENLRTKGTECKTNSLISEFHMDTEKCNKFDKNKYRLRRSSSKLTNINKPLKANSQTINKVWQNQSKIKLLKADFKVNNIPCRLFKKYGKCLRQDYGKCDYLHDKKHVSLCRKFLKGICHDSNCSLSHEVTANKMPTCFFYLKGMCTKENCPYVHIKLNDKIKICQNFIKGYCENGVTCKFRHVKLDECKKSKSCKRTKLRKGKSKSAIQKKSVALLNDKRNTEPQNKEVSNDCRYYKEIVTVEDNCKNIKPTRCKIGTLPSFIQL